MVVLYKHTQEREVMAFRLNASLHGVDLDAEQTETQKEIPIDPFKTKEGFFQDPEDYAHMTDDEKEKETQRMMRNLKNLAGTPGHPLSVLAGK